MKRILAVSLLTLAVLGSVASADRRRGGRSRHDHHRDHGWSGGVVVRTSPVRVIGPGVHRLRPRTVRHPIYVQRPALTVRYYRYDRRPTVLAESYNNMAGYYWVAGSWSWNGYEWMWTQGHYEPDPNYVEPGYYDDSYPVSSESSYYDGY